MAGGGAGQGVDAPPPWLGDVGQTLQPMAVIAQGRHVWTNDAYAALVDRPRDQLQDRPLHALLSSEDGASLLGAQARLGTARPSVSLEVGMMRPGGELRTVALVLTRLGDRDATDVMILIAGWDLTGERATQQRLRHHATHDPASGLPNRVVFLEHLHHAMARLDRMPGACAYVLFIDLNRLKHVTDAYGHAARDQLLTEVADRLRHARRPHDILARVGGGQFIILLEDVRDRSHTLAMAQRCLTIISADYPIAGNAVRVTASIGIAATDVGRDAEEVLAQADAAMSRAKTAGGDRIEFPHLPHPLHLGTRPVLERQLAGALSRGELRVYYQPIIDLTDGRVIAGEALLRWAHPERGLLAAAEFIDIAEEAGFISRIGEWVCDTVTADLASWDRNGAPIAQVYLNVALQQLTDGTFVNHVERSLGRHGLSADRLCLEITETEIMSSSSISAHLLALHQLGCALVVDDFGTGYSSLSRLIDLPVDVVKVDRSFVAGIGVDSRPTAVISATLLLAHNLRQLSIAEGVETIEQHRWLIEAGCTHAQGFLLGRPEPAAVFIDLTSRENSRPAVQRVGRGT